MAEKTGWPNVKDQYELLDVIGLYRHSIFWFQTRWFCGQGQSPSQF